MTSALRIAAMVLIFIGATISWQVLGFVTSSRTGQRGSTLGEEVRSLWGTQQTQVGPGFRFHWETRREVEEVQEEKGRQRRVRKQVIDTYEREVLPFETTLAADVDLDQRLRGLMWYSLYGVTFDGRWRYRHEASDAGHLTVDFAFPAADAIYDDFRFILDGKDLGPSLRPEAGKVRARIAVAPGQVVELVVRYKTRGLDLWSYQPQQSSVANLRNFSLTVTCDFAEIDYPTAALSPSTRTRTGAGWTLGWKFNQVLTGQAMGLVMPARIQPGELASALSHSAPVSLLFFYLVIFSLAVMRRLDIHPINYLAIAGAFFSFHLLFAYSVDHLSLGVAFALASAVSLVLVATYLRLVVSPTFAYREAVAAQLIYQVGFSAAHFFPGYTGLTISVLATVTLFFLMQLTGRVRWSSVFTRHPAPPAAAPHT